MPVSSPPRAGGGAVGGGGGVAPWFLASLLWSPARTPGGYGGVACSPRPWPLLMAGGVAPRIAPCRVLGRGCLAAPGAGRGLAGRWWVSLAGGRGAGGRSASVCLSAAPGWASRRPTLSLRCPPDRTGLRPRAAARMRSAGCPCAPAQGGWPSAGTVGVGERLTGGMRRTAACTLAAGPLPGCRGPLREGVSLWPGGGGAGLPSPWPACGCPRAWGGRGGRGGGGSPLSPFGPPVLLSDGCGGLPDGLGPGGPAVDGGGGALPSRSHSTHRVLGCRAGPHPWAPRSSRCCRLAAWLRRGGGDGGRWGRRSGSVGLFKRLGLLLRSLSLGINMMRDD